MMEIIWYGVLLLIYIRDRVNTQPKYSNTSQIRWESMNTNTP